MQRLIYMVIMLTFFSLLTACSTQRPEKHVSGNITSETTVKSADIEIKSPMTLSNNVFIHNEKTTYLRLKMVKGRYYEDWTPGAYMGTIWEGSYVAELADEYGKTIAQTDLSSYFSEPLTFKFSFNIELEDYNNDGDIDFALGQYASSNGRQYKLFTIRKDGRIEELKVKDDPYLFISSATGYYSTKLDRVDEFSFKKEYYDNSQGKHFEDLYRWEGNEFVHVKKQEIKPLSPEDMQIGDISIGDSIEKVQKLYGAPTKRTVAHGIGDPLWYYKNHGLEVSFGGPIWRIIATRKFSGGTPRGIHIGSTRQEVAAAYPGIKEVKFENSTGMVLFSPDHKYSINFGFEGDTAASIALIKDLE